MLIAQNYNMRAESESIEAIANSYSTALTDFEIAVACTIVALSIIVPCVLAWIDHRRDVHLAEMKGKPRPSFWAGWV